MQHTSRTKRAFTLVEMSVTMLVVSIIGLILLSVFRSNIAAWKWGSKHMEFNQKIQLAMKQVFTDIKRINPVVYADETGNYWFKGEKIGDLVPNLEDIIDLDKEPANGGEELMMWHTSYVTPGEKTGVRLFLEEGALVRELILPNDTRRKSVVSNRVADLHFQKNVDDPLEIKVSMVITDDRNPELKETLAFAVHLDTDLVYVRMAGAEVEP